MTALDDSAPLDERFECRFDFEPGWIDLTLREATKNEARTLAREVVHGLNPLGLEIETSAVFEDTVERAIDLNEDVPILAAAYYTEAGEPLANLVVDSYGDEGVPRPRREEVQPRLLEWANARVAGEPQVAYLDLSAGPAVRVQAMLQVKRVLGFGRRLTEFIKYAVFPPGMQSLVVVTVTWEKIARAEEITALADEAVRTLRIAPLGPGGSAEATK
ncbi:hypothetical protein [Streptomyces sp. NPDC086787]|uniref:hypothetical protein n=1 Tax=Streptomyces sp. NPDC086787 TaxID=3365759 RepID=UPI003813B78D